MFTTNVPPALQYMGGFFHIVNDVYYVTDARLEDLRKSENNTHSRFGDALLTYRYIERKCVEHSLLVLPKDVLLNNTLIKGLALGGEPVARAILAIADGSKFETIDDFKDNPTALALIAFRSSRFTAEPVGYAPDGRIGLDVYVNAVDALCEEMGIDNHVQRSHVFDDTALIYEHFGQSSYSDAYANRHVDNKPADDTEPPTIENDLKANKAFQKKMLLWMVLGVCVVCAATAYAVECLF